MLALRPPHRLPLSPLAIARHARLSTAAAYTPDPASATIDIVRPPPPKDLIPPPSTFTRADLATIRTALLPPPTAPYGELPAHTAKFDKRPPRDAAVLIPLANIGGVATMLMQMRAAGLRVHAGEAGFPGGKAEEGDENVIQTALRETEEELKLPASHVEILGAMEPEYSLGNKARVWPIIGFVHTADAFDAATDAAISGAVDSTLTRSALPSLSLSSLCPDPGEVSGLIPLPLSTVADPARQAAHYFRLDGRRPYWKIRCGDLIHPPPDEPLPIEVWGLSGWFLSRLALRLKWSDVPPKSMPPTDD